LSSSGVGAAGVGATASFAPDGGNAAEAERLFFLDFFFLPVVVDVLGSPSPSSNAKLFTKEAIKAI